VSDELNLSRFNRELSLVSLRTRNNSSRFYLSSRHFPMGLRANHRNLPIALARAKEIDSALILGKFDWTPYLSDSQRPPVLVKEWLVRLQRDYWESRQRTLNTENTWRKSYQLYYAALPPEQELTETLLIEGLKRYLPQSRSRQLASVAYGKLASFAGLNRQTLTELGKGYQPAAKTKADILSDDQVLFQVENCSDSGWRWCVGMAATFGLRNHELVRLDLTRLSEGVIRVLENAKTGGRVVYACPFEWVARFDLVNVRMPNLKIEGRSNNAIGSSISQGFKRNGLSPFYCFRDHYAIALEFYWPSRTPIKFKADWMGHSVKVHEDNYLDIITEIDHDRMYARLRNGHSLDFNEFGMDLDRIYAMLRESKFKDR
jgi:integrase